MIKLERTSVMNFENALRGMRNPMNSWDKSDSFFCDDLTDYDKCVNCRYVVSEYKCNRPECGYIIGNNDLDLARKLVNAGSDHRKFLRQIFVSVDVTAPLYWWKEMDQYRIAVTTNSTSTMHKIHAKEFSLEDFSSERMDSDTLISLMATINVLEKNRVKYNESKDVQYWHNMIQLLPTSYNQMRTCTLNYENLINIYYARRHHKLPEWHEFCGWIEGLPYFREICIERMEER